MVAFPDPLNGLGEVAVGTRETDHLLAALVDTCYWQCWQMS